MAIKLVTIDEIADFDGQLVKLRGWLYNKRSSGKLHFLQVRDGTGIIQCVVFNGDVSVEEFQLAGRITQEAAIVVHGEVKRDDRSSAGFELAVTTIEVINESAPYPISPKEHGVAFLMENRHLWLRSSRPHAVLKIRNCVIES